MNRFPSYLPLILVAFLVGSPVCRAENQSENETPHWQPLPAETPPAQTPPAATTEAPAQGADTTAPAAADASSSLIDQPSVQAPAPAPATAAAPAPETAVAAPVTAARAPVSKPYRVRIWQTNGECLWRIAEKVYGDRSKWRLIYLANKDVIRDPNKIYPKQRLKIPPSDWQP